MQDRRIPPLMGSLFGCQRRIRQVLHADMEARGVAREEFDVLAMLATGGMTCKELAKRVIVPNPTLTRTLARMEEKGLVQATKGATDGRQKIVSLTQAGLETYERVFPPHVDLVLRGIGHLDAPEQAELDRLLKKLAAGFATEGGLP